MREKYKNIDINIVECDLEKIHFLAILILKLTKIIFYVKMQS